MLGAPPPGYSSWNEYQTDWLEGQAGSGPRQFPTAGPGPGEGWSTPPAQIGPTPSVNRNGGGQPRPGVMSNVLMDTTSPEQMGTPLAGLQSYAEATYGSTELGVVRNSSWALENERSGVRPGTMPRVVRPPWAMGSRRRPL